VSHENDNSISIVISLEALAVSCAMCHGYSQVVSGFFADFNAKKRMMLVNVTLYHIVSRKTPTCPHQGSNNPKPFEEDLQNTHSEHGHEQELLAHGLLQLVHHVHRQEENQDIRNNREHCIRIPRINQVVARARLRLVPRPVDRRALEDASNACGKCKSADKAQ
jgi:hypothetical protein